MGTCEGKGVYVVGVFWSEFMRDKTLRKEQEIPSSIKREEPDTPIN